MSEVQTNVVIVGGGSAGWLTAGVLASRFASEGQRSMCITLVESPDVQTVGVGEGTWPSMRSTLQNMGISETDFMRECDVTLKQGSRFDGWVRGSEMGDDYYYHPFSLPQGFSQMNLAEYWLNSNSGVSFANAVSAQSAICENGLAAKKISTPEFAFNVNYGYHLDAGKFANFLKSYCTKKLGVSHVLDHLVKVNSTQTGDIASIETRRSGSIAGDLFIDCTGFASILLGQHYGIKLREKRDTLFNDSAIALQVPYKKPDDPVLPYTLSTAQHAGWIWDIGLSTRRGVGYVYSSYHTSDQDVYQALTGYLSKTIGIEQAEKLATKKITFKPGYREKFWHKNCLAIGLSAGFVEPLEASALVLVELSAQMLSEQFPVDRKTMDIIAKRFNHKFSYRWEQIVDFLKLHYVLSQRSSSDYWLDNCRNESISDSLTESLQLWRTQAPWHFDTPHIDEMFPSASFQYVLYGMGFKTEVDKFVLRGRTRMRHQAEALIRENNQQRMKLLNALPQHRELLNKVSEFGFQKI